MSIDWQYFPRGFLLLPSFHFLNIMVNFKWVRTAFLGSVLFCSKKTQPSGGWISINGQRYFSVNCGWHLINVNALHLRAVLLVEFKLNKRRQLGVEGFFSYFPISNYAAWKCNACTNIDASQVCCVCWRCCYCVAVVNSNFHSCLLFVFCLPFGAVPCVRVSI